MSQHIGQTIGVTGPQRLVIRLVGQKPRQTASEIAAMLGKHPSTLTGVLARLEERGMLARETDAEDRRRALRTRLDSLRPRFAPGDSATRRQRFAGPPTDVLEREREAAARESTLGRREQKLALLEAELRTSAIALRDLEAEVRTRETRLVALRDYAILMQRTFRRTKLKSQSAPESDPTTATPAKTSSAPPQ